MKRLFLVIVLISIYHIDAQDMKLPYHQIPDYPEDYNTGNVIGRMIDGLGYRYHWATEGLTDADLNYKPSENARTMLETLQHIYGMSEMILEAPQGKPSLRPKNFTQYSFQELRKKTLENLDTASKLIKGKSNEQVSTFKITFQRGDKQTEFPYWNMINGMISDCIHHTGQLVTMRRANGNPQSPKVNVFLGKTRE